jgi:lipopolysaccharide export system protein LptA
MMVRTEARRLLRPVMLLTLAAGMAPGWMAPAARAQAPGTGFANSYSANSGKPVDIEADTLEVDDRKKTAVFKGNVSATQGDMNITSQQISVIYTSGGGAKQADASGKAVASPLGAGGDISIVNARGNVVVTMKADQQRAESDWAIFDVQKQQITMGDSVELSKGANRENVLRGTKLVIDLASGQTKFDSSGQAAGRIRAIFTPDEKMKKKEKDKDKDKKDGAN